MIPLVAAVPPPLPRSHSQPVGGRQRHHLHQRLRGRRLLCVWPLQLRQARPSEHDAGGQAGLQVLCPHHLCGLSASAPKCVLPPARSRPRPALPFSIPTQHRPEGVRALSPSASTDPTYESQPPPRLLQLDWTACLAFSYLFVALLQIPHPPHLSLAHRPASVAARTRCCSCPHPSPPPARHTCMHVTVFWSSTPPSGQSFPQQAHLFRTFFSAPHLPFYIASVAAVGSHTRIAPTGPPLLGAASPPAALRHTIQRMRTSHATASTHHFTPTPPPKHSSAVPPNPRPTNHHHIHGNPFPPRVLPAHC